MDLIEIASKLFIDKLGSDGSGLDSGAVTSALGGLLAGSDGKLDLGDLVEKFSGGDLLSLAQSWLGDGANSSISPQQIASVLGQSNIAEFASKLGLGEGAAGDGLAKMIPDLIDGNSKGGSLLDAVGGTSGLMGMASKFFK